MKILNWLLPNLLFAGFIVPLDNTQSQWKLLSFDGLPANKVQFSKEKLIVKVEKSASPLIYKLKSPQKFQRVKLKGKISPGLNLPKNKKQGDKKADDFALRIGLVVKGTKKAPSLPGWMIADWIEELFSLAPKGVGVDKILFLNATADSSLLGKGRDHPLKKDLIREEFVWTYAVGKEFSLEHKLKKPVEVLGLWISIDGDDTKSSYITEISYLGFE